MAIQGAGLPSHLTMTSAAQATAAAPSAWNDALTQAAVEKDPAATTDGDKAQGSVSGAIASTATPAPPQHGDATTAPPALSAPPQALSASANAGRAGTTTSLASTIASAATAATGLAETASHLARASASASQAETSQPATVKTHKSTTPAIQGLPSAVASADLPTARPSPPSDSTILSSDSGVEATEAQSDSTQTIVVAPSDLQPLSAALAGTTAGAMTLPLEQGETALASSGQITAAAATVPGQSSGDPVKRPSVARDPSVIERPPQSQTMSMPTDTTGSATASATVSVAHSGAVAPASLATAPIASSPVAQPSVSPTTSAAGAAAAPVASPQANGQSSVSGATPVASHTPTPDQAAAPAATDASRAAASMAIQPRDDRKTSGTVTTDTTSSGVGSAAAFGIATSPNLASANAGQPVSASQPAAVSSSRSALSDSAVPATPTALAATVVAMTGSGHSSAVLRLAPPDLGTLSIHVAYAADASVNLVFVPSTSQTAQLLSGGMEGLRHAMATAGLTLGQAQIGGGAGGGNAAGGGNSGFFGQRQNAGTQTAEVVARPTPATIIDGRGARAIA